MKKIIFVSLLLIGFSAFAFSPNYCGVVNTQVAKIEKKMPKPSPAPVAADMVMFPHLGM